jgi:hypothetical protein
MIIGFSAVAVAIPAGAHASPPVEHEHYEITDSYPIDGCGFEIWADLTAEGHFMAREVAGSNGEAYLGHDNYSFRQVTTNVETGEYFVVRGKGMFKEMTGVHVSGDIWEFTAQDVGQPFVIEDSDGKVVLRDRGRITVRAVADTLGDGQVGAILLEEEITGVFGPHPSFTADFCEIATELIGSP